MTCPHRCHGCTLLDPATDLWAGTLPKPAPPRSRPGHLHHHNHAVCVTDGPDCEVGWHPADDEPHPEPWVWRRARHPIQHAHPVDGRVLPWRVIASTVATAHMPHTAALTLLDRLYAAATHPADMPPILGDVLTGVAWAGTKTATLLELADRWGRMPADWQPPSAWVASVPGCGPVTVDAYRVLVLGEDPRTANPVLVAHAALRHVAATPTVATLPT